MARNVAETAAPALKVLAFNCSLRSAKSKEKSSTESLLRQLMDELEKHGAKGGIVRATPGRRCAGA
jgi:hypothetical protein